MLKEYAPPGSRIDQKFARRRAELDIAVMESRLARVAQSEDYAVMKPYLDSGAIRSSQSLASEAAGLAF